MDQRITNAINSMKLLSLRCDDDFITRQVEPHCYGVNRKGDEVLKAYQVSGPPDSDEFSSGWRSFSVPNLFGLAVTEETFDRPRNGHKQNYEAMQKIFAQL